MSLKLPPGLDLSKIPLASNPSGAPPNFEHGASLRPVVLGVDIAMVVISGLFVGIRTWVNCRQLSKVMLDDGMSCTSAHAASANRDEYFASSGGSCFWHSAFSV